LAGLINSFTGGAFSRASIMALGIMPYISASIVMQLLGVAVPQIQKIQKDGESGRKKIQTYTKILTIVITVLQAPSYLATYAREGIPADATFMSFQLPAIAVMVASTMLLMWMGDRITDKGIGMSKEFVMKYFSRLLHSTKESTDDLIGGYGIGSKTALSYCNSFFIETIKNDEKNLFFVSRETTNSITITCLLTEHVNDIASGTTIKVYLKESYNENVQFIETCCTELAYFDNVILKCNKSSVNNTISNYNYGKIIEGKTFKYRTGSQYANTMHIILGKVAYAIDWKEIGLNSHDFLVSVGIKFDIGELQVNMTRESVIYTDATKILIKDKILAVKKELCDIYNSSNKPIHNIFEFIIKSKLERELSKHIKFKTIYGEYSLWINCWKEDLSSTKLYIANKLDIDIANTDDILPFIIVFGKITNGFHPRS